MHWKPKGWTLIGMLLLAVPGAMTVMKVAAAAQATSGSAIATTQVTDTVYLADGTTATGTVIVSWQAFTTASGQSVPSGTTSATIGAGGTLSMQLVPNAGSTPMGTYYTAVFQLSDGSVSREFWVVPTSQTPVAVSTIESTVIPTSVAMQTVSKSYVDTAIAAAVSGHPLDSSNPFVEKAGDTMTGPLVLPGDPTTPNQAADKNYVDTNIAAVEAGLGQKVSLVPSGTQTVTQPTGTQMQVNLLNGEEYASQYVTGTPGGNGIANAVASPDCASGCDVKVDRSYSAQENYHSATWKSGSGGTHLEDDRNGERNDSYLNPTSSVGNGNDAGQVIDVVSTRSSAAEFAAGGSATPNSSALLLSHEGMTGGSNLFPQTIESVPYFKTNYNAMSVSGTYNTMGQHLLDAQRISCYGVGDCLIGSQFIVSSGGLRDEADEGAHPFDLQMSEDTAVFEGTCSAGCSPGSTVVTVAVSAGPGTQGEGRYLIDKNPSKVMTAGELTGSMNSLSVGSGATFSGTNFPVSVFLATAQVIPSQANNIAPGTVIVPIATSGVTAGFATNTAAIPSPSGVACVADQSLGNPTNYEMANYSVVDGTHLQMTLNKVHQVGATIAFGGLCGYGLEQTVDTVGQIRQVFPVIGSYSPTGLYYGGALGGVIGVQSNTSAFFNMTMQIASIARNNGVVTVTMAGNPSVDVNGLTMNVTGVADQSYNGSFVVTTTSANTLTYAQAGANSTSTGGSVSKLTGGYVLYPMAEVLGVFDTATNSIDGQLTLAPNNVAWGANDALEEPHFYQQKIAADTTFIAQTTPRPEVAVTAGVQYNGTVGPGLSGWTIANGAPASSYFGNGGTHSTPAAAFVASGVWGRTMDLQAGEQTVFAIHCNSHGCGNWNSGYTLFAFDSSVGGDRISYQPQTSTLQMNIGNATYQFGPQSFTTGTINAGTVNATTLNGTVGAAQLPLFGASGIAHGPGAVPDPGATAGTTRYLREDGTWDVPAGSTVTGQSAGGGLTGAVAIAGATADYNFMQGSGTALVDITSNGNNGTLGTGSLAPTWTATGLSFSGQQQVVLPAALNGSKTVFFGVYINPIPKGADSALSAEAYTMLVGSSLGGGGLNLLLTNQNASNSTFQPYIYAANSFSTGVNTTYSGFHVIAYVLGDGGGSRDHIYIDGIETASYASQGASAGLQTGGNLYLGSSDTAPFTASGFLGTMYRAAFLPVNTLSASQITMYSNQIRTSIMNEGVATYPQPVPQSNATIFAIGDSITCGLDIASGSCDLTPWPSLLSLTNQPSYTIDDYGIPSITARAIVGSESNRTALQCLSSGVGPQIALVLAGTNDLFDFGGGAPAGAIGSIAAEVQLLKAAGCRVFVGTLISGNGIDAARDTLDASILTSARTFGADGIIDFAANPLLGADGASANPNPTACSSGTCFQTDGVHPTQAGQQLLANAASNSLNYYFGYNEMNPHTVTSLPYSMTAGDGEVSLAGVTGAGRLTLPDCTGQSGAIYRINNPQAAFAVTVAPLNGSQLINGLAVGTAVTVPANGSVTLRDVPNPKTVSGCHWEM
jgi:trimeric autotransporter adhesin